MDPIFGGPYLRAYRLIESDQSRHGDPYREMTCNYQCRTYPASQRDRGPSVPKYSDRMLHADQTWGAETSLQGQHVPDHRGETSAGCTEISETLTYYAHTV